MSWWELKLKKDDQLGDIALVFREFPEGADTIEIIHDWEVVERGCEQAVVVTLTDTDVMILLLRRREWDVNGLWQS